MFLGIPIINAVGSQRRKLQYLPPRIAIEGHGIKRGLTAVEAAILMEQPLDKVMTMILFGVIKKNAAEVLSRDPLQVKVASPLPEGLHEYEVNFLKAFQEDDPKTRRNLIQDMMVKLVKAVSEKMKGFSRRETVDYYKNIMEKAWEQVEAGRYARSQETDLRREPGMDHARQGLRRPHPPRLHRTGLRPDLVGTLRPDLRTGHALNGQRQGLHAVFFLRKHAVCAEAAGLRFCRLCGTGHADLLAESHWQCQDFTSRVTNVTNPPPPSTSGGSRGGRSGGGGRSCACACACAGCACACAGGGR